MASLEAGRRLADRYELKERLGDGGHAEVWAALDERSGRLVALKFLHLRSCTPAEALPVLQHEARMAQRLEHPGVLRVEDPERDGDCVFLPVEYAPGGSAARLRGAPWRQVLPVLLQVAQVLEHAHARGVVHRDIKPGNVLFSAGGLVRLSDFGTSARAGSTDAPATGSPFSASPQQLRGEAASPADDVYGLGALTYELLTRYPPFYPQFDAERVQQQDPPRPAPVHPAPATLLDLVQRMLAREAGDRPSLAEVMQALEVCLALPEQADEGALLVEAVDGSAASRKARRRSVPAWWWLAAAAAAGLAVLVLLPEPAPLQPQVVGEAPVRASVADAVVREPAAEAAAAETAAPEAAATAAQPRTSAEDEVRAGRKALAALKPAEARAAFQRALVREPEHAGALAGLATAHRQEELLGQLAEGTRAEAAGDLEQARDRYRLLVANEPDFAPAQAALSRIEARMADRTFEDHLAAAAVALRKGDLDGAEAAHQRAAAIRPGDARVQDVRLRIAEIQRDRQNSQDLQAGAALEAAERWDEAIAHYKLVLEREAGLRFALDGLARAERRAELDRELADYQARPERLTAPAVRSAAQRALARGEASAADSPRLAAQLQWLRGALDTVREPVRVELTSDNSTQISVTRFGELGRFESRELTLPPGQYTIIGRREGFRDVRLELNLAPGQRSMALLVACTERI